MFGQEIRGAYHDAVVLLCLKRVAGKGTTWSSSGRRCFKEEGKAHGYRRSRRDRKGGREEGRNLND